MDRISLPIPGPPHDDRYLLRRNLGAEAPVREHHHVGRGSSSWTNECKKRFQSRYASSRKSSTRTRTTEFLFSEERENKAKTCRRRSASKIRMDESSSSSSKNWWQHENEHRKITNGEIINGEFAICFSKVSRTDISECRARDRE